MLKKTLIASTLTLGLALGAQGVQANPITDFISGFVGGDVGAVQQEARRGGFRSSSRRSTATKSSTTSSSRAVTTTNNRSSTSSTTNNTNRTNTTNNANNQQDAQFSSNAYRSNPNAVGTGAGPNGLTGPQAAYAQRGSMGMGSTFLSSLAGAGAGVLLANMLLTPTAAAAAGTEVATPDMLSDEQLTECLTQLDTDLKDAQQRLLDAAPEETDMIREEITQMNNLKITLLQEQLNRLQGSSAS